MVCYNLASSVHMEGYKEVCLKFRCTCQEGFIGSGTLCYGNLVMVSCCV